MKKNNRQPLVSVIMPVYNAGGYLVKAIESVLKQTYKNYMLIVINDASTDNSAQVIEKYQKKFPKKIKVITMKRNLNRGGDSCANEGLKIAKGKYVARMDADDVAHPKRLEKQVKFLQENPSFFIVGTNANVINDKGKIMGEKLEPLTHDKIYKSYFTFHPMIHPSSMFRRVIDGKPFFYQIKYSANNDYYTFFKLICKGFKFANLKDKLLYYRIHKTNDTFVHMKRKYFNTMATRIEMFMKYRYEPTLKQIATVMAQTIVLLLLPEKVTKQMYLFSKGIVKFQNPLKSIMLKKA